MASQKLIKEELTPLVNAYEEQLQKQQNWIGKFKWVSPAVIAQESLNQMAGTSTQDYENFRKQVVGFADEWRGHLLPLLYNNTDFTKADIANLPVFEYDRLQRGSLAPLVIFLIAIGVFGIGFLAAKRKKSNLIIT